MHMFLQMFNGSLLQCPRPSFLLFGTHTYICTHMRNTKEGPGTGLQPKPPLPPDWEPSKRRDPIGGDTFCAPQGTEWYEVFPANSWIGNTSPRLQHSPIPVLPRPSLQWPLPGSTETASTSNSPTDPSLNLVALCVPFDFGLLNSPP